MDPVRRSQLRTGLAVALVFLVGVALGAVVSRGLQQRRLRELILGDPATLRTELTLHALERRLDLSDAQRAEAERLLREQEEPYRAALEASRPRVRELRRELAERLRPALDPDQRATLEELLREGERFR